MKLTEPMLQGEIRAAALVWLDQMTRGGEIPLSREQLANDFFYYSERFPLIDRGRGIRKPVGWEAALSLTTAAPKSGRARPYDDVEGPDGLYRYKLRRDELGRSENAGLRAALRLDVPLAWFYGLEPALFQVISPVYLREEEPHLSQFSLALTEAQRMVAPGTTVEGRIRRYLISQTRQRLHQPVFASQIMIAYAERCAVCSLHHRELLDAAHIIPDSRPHGFPIVTNGMALCKIHHAAYDYNILGIRRDHVVEINHIILEETDGPMLLYGLQGRHGQRLMTLPKRALDRPDPARLEERYAEFRAA